MAANIINCRVIVNDAARVTDISVDRQRDASQTVEIDHRVADKMASQLLRDPILTSIDIVIGVDSLVVERDFNQDATRAAAAAAAGQVFSSAVVSLRLDATKVTVEGKGHGKGAAGGVVAIRRGVRQGLFGKCCCRRR